MSYLVLARKWRPRTFDEVVGQMHVTHTLKNAITRGRVSHAFLFAGARGVGKTTAARILAKALNCAAGPTPVPCNQCTNCGEITQGNAVDVYEIDGASHRGINEVRDIIEGVKYLPAKCRYKIYIIDEVQQLTHDAFNALLKTLEEPPPQVKFIFATTEPHKLPQTILSRCQRYDFKRISLHDMIGRLRSIAETEGIQISAAALSLLAREADGSLRDAESLLDQVITFAGKDIAEKDVLETVGAADRKILFDIARAVIDRNASRTVELADQISQYGYDVRRLCRDLLEHFRNLVVAKLFQDRRMLTDLPDHEVEGLMEQAQGRSLEDLQRFFKVMMHEEEEISRSLYPLLLLEMALVKLATLEPVVPAEEILEKIAEVERRIGQFPLASQPEPEEKENSPDPVTPEKTESDPPPVQEFDETSETLWKDFLTFVKGEKISLFFVLSHCRLLHMSPGSLHIGVEKEPYFKDLSKKETRALLHTLACQFFHEEVKVVITSTRDMPSSAASPVSTAVEDDSPAPGKEASQDPMVRAALEIFGGEIQPPPLKNSR